MVGVRKVILESGIVSFDNDGFPAAKVVNCCFYPVFIGVYFVITEVQAGVFDCTTLSQDAFSAFVVGRIRVLEFVDPLSNFEWTQEWRVNNVLLQRRNCRSVVLDVLNCVDFGRVVNVLATRVSFGGYVTVVRKSKDVGLQTHYLGLPRREEMA